MPKIELPWLTCTRCGHRWHPRSEQKPINCASCNSPYWDRPRQLCTPAVLARIAKTAGYMDESHNGTTH